ncbi:tetratricopeptide repeat protein [Desulfovibrio sp. Huiquan2017]|uniref:tetratricopeptide repeat protein n=1 Tax=Desulfovibrio sp. Huiquan2017 TaxID=2816861 RepID=UPI001A91B93E|nr:tetratricopeptide repeat protein [Desulfovibrio sp. Huiquan2017]
MAEKKIDKSRRNFLFGAVRRIRKEDDQPVASTAGGIEVVKAANALYVDEQWEEARLKYKECLEQDKNDADVRYRLGVCSYKRGMFRQAKLEFERALRIDQTYQDAFLYLGLTLVRLGRSDKAPAVWSRYFNPSAVKVMRELNLQLGLIETGQPDPDEDVALAVEKAIAESGGAVG